MLNPSPITINFDVIELVILTALVTVVVLLTKALHDFLITKTKTDRKARR